MQLTTYLIFILVQVLEVIGLGFTTTHHFIIPDPPPPPCTPDHTHVCTSIPNNHSSTYLGVLEGPTADLQHQHNNNNKKIADLVKIDPDHYKNNNTVLNAIGSRPGESSWRPP